MSKCDRAALAAEIFHATDPGELYGRVLCTLIAKEAGNDSNTRGRLPARALDITAEALDYLEERGKSAS